MRRTLDISRALDPDGGDHMRKRGLQLARGVLRPVLDAAGVGLCRHDVGVGEHVVEEAVGFVVDHVGDELHVVALLARARLHVRVGALVRTAQYAHLQHERAVWRWLVDANR